MAKSMVVFNFENFQIIGQYMTSQGIQGPKISPKGQIMYWPIIWNFSNLNTTIDFPMPKLVWIPNFYFYFRFLQKLLIFHPLGWISGSWVRCDVMYWPIMWKCSNLNITMQKLVWIANFYVSFRFLQKLLIFDPFGGILGPWLPCDVIGGSIFSKFSKLNITIELFMQKVVWMPNFYFSFRFSQQLLAFDAFGGHSGPWVRGTS